MFQLEMCCCCYSICWKLRLFSNLSKTKWLSFHPIKGFHASNAVQCWSQIIANWSVNVNRVRWKLVFFTTIHCQIKFLRRRFQRIHEMELNPWESLISYYLQLDTQPATENLFLWKNLNEHFAGIESIFNDLLSLHPSIVKSIYFP